MLRKCKLSNTAVPIREAKRGGRSRPPPISPIGTGGPELCPQPQENQGDPRNRTCKSVGFHDVSRALCLSYTPGSTRRSPLFPRSPTIWSTSKCQSRSLYPVVNLQVRSRTDPSTHRQATTWRLAPQCSNTEDRPERSRVNGSVPPVPGHRLRPVDRTLSPGEDHLQISIRPSQRRRL